MRCAPVLFGSLCGLAAAPLACGLDRAGTLPQPDQVTAIGGYGTGAEGGSGGTGATSTGAGGTGAGGTGAGGTGAGGTGGQPLACGAGYECVPAPSGATHVVVSSGGCPAGWETPHELYDGPDPGCEPCSCAGSAGSCTEGTVSRYTDTTCGGQNLKDSQQPSDGDCVDVHESSAGQQADSYLIEVDPSELGCPALVSQPEDLTIHDACEVSAPVAATCGEGNACVPTVVPTDQLCVLLGDHVSCPPGFPNPRSLYDTANDSRSCHCDCSAPTGTSCAGAHVILYSNTSCNSVTTAQLDAGQCRDASLHNWHDGYLFEAGTYQAGSCSPIDQHTGLVDFSDPVTLCCES